MENIIKMSTSRNFRNSCMCVFNILNWKEMEITQNLAFKGARAYPDSPLSPPFFFFCKASSILLADPPPPLPPSI